ncbi:hypothetical protein [Actinacidiphila alni]|nr:hypothetical protein [Actinacidiphila alni]
MAATGSRVEVGAMLAAWDQACVVRAGFDTTADSGYGVKEAADAVSRIAEATVRYGSDQLGRGTVVLLGQAVRSMGTGPAADRRAHLVSSFTKTLADKLTGLTETWPDLVEAADLPMVHKVVGLAMAGHTDLLTWRDEFGPVPEGEHHAMTAALALTAEFVDLVDGPGACGRRLLAELENDLG